MLSEVDVRTSNGSEENKRVKTSGGVHVSGTHSRVVRGTEHTSYDTSPDPEDSICQTSALRCAIHYFLSSRQLFTKNIKTPTQTLAGA